MFLLVKHVFILALVIAFWEASPVVTGISIGMSEVSVSVTNSLQGNLNLTIHCKSKDDDLGIHVLPFNGRYQWQFKPNIFGTTLFSCDLSMRDGSIGYDLYSYEKDRLRCPTECIWVAKTEGLVGLSQDAAFSTILVKWQRRAN
ncbi:unnamed protein product [Lupinus luteus]|uniref:S-protein homolog n=1 Tax=Lupinus luteus TaxID=3873 RepID=A0AAV1X1H2_LUPLU